jgi:hypothetical protein
VIGVGDDLDAAVGAAGDGVPGQVELGVVVPAQRDQVVERGGPAAAPMPAVMTVAPERGDVAAGVLAVPVADHYRAAQPGRHHPGSPPDIERLGRGVGDDPMHRGVAVGALGRID